jgi:hypothetical protein
MLFGVRTARGIFAALLLLSGLFACGNQSAESLAEPVFPEDVADWQEGRACAFTHEHELRYIRVVVDEKAAAPYRELHADFPYEVGATLVKLEYDDENCSRLLGYTAMQKQEAGYSPEGNDWRWQRVDIDRQVTEDGTLPTCINCHYNHCTEPICGYDKCGFDLTCGLEEL